jgi:transposase
METKGSKQGRKRRAHSEEFRLGAIRLVVEEGRSVREVARDLDLHPSLLHTWIRQANVDAARGPKGPLTSAEREELSELRRKVHVLEMERALLKKAAAFFAKENA